MKIVKAARVHGYGGPEAVRIEETTLPDPKAGEVLVRVQAAGINPIDWKIRAGYLKDVMPLPTPFTLGVDFAGVVEAFGPAVSGFEVGQAIYGEAPVFKGASGSFAQALIAKSGNIAPRPSNTDAVEAAALPLAGVSALQAMEALVVTEGRKVLIHGGGGGIGSLAIQMAKHFGAWVATTVSADDVEYVKSLGADRIINYRTERFDELLSGLDGVFDTVGGDSYARSFKVLRNQGRLVSLLERPREDLMGQSGVVASVQFTDVTTQRLAKLTDLVQRGIVKVHIDRTFPLEAAAAALRHLEKESPRGKVVLELV